MSEDHETPKLTSVETVKTNDSVNFLRELCSNMNFRRRGSRKSLVETIHIASDAIQVVVHEQALQKARSVCDQGSSTNLHQPENNVDSNILQKTQQEINRLQAENQIHEEAKTAAEDQTIYLENLLKEREAEILSLSTRLETLTQRNNELEENHCSELYEAKTQYMINLEMELKKVKEESSKMVARSQKKLKILRETNSKSKQEYALKVFVLKDENNKLLQENGALQDHLRSQSQDFNDATCSADGRKCETLTHSPKEKNFKNGSRSELIVQLSQQVTSLDVENRELKQELQKAKTLINKFKLKGKTQEVDTKTQQKHERQELCISVAGLDIRSSSSEVELFG